jgi:hypothetical protein
MKIKLRMVQSDIDDAISCSKRFCAIARTIYRQLNAPVGRVRVTTAGASILKGDYRYHYRVPHRACRLVSEFDAGKPVRPIAFSLEFSSRRKVTNISDERRHQINTARRAATAALLATGEKPKRYPRGRYGI